MSFMPSPPSVIRLKDGRIATMDTVTPDGKGDRALVEWEEDGRLCWDLIPVTVDDIDEVLQEFD